MVQLTQQINENQAEHSPSYQSLRSGLLLAAPFSIFHFPPLNQIDENENDVDFWLRGWQDLAVDAVSAAFLAK